MVPPLYHGNLLDRVERVKPGVVYQNVETAGTVDNLGNEGVDFGFLANIDLAGKAFAVCLCDQTDSLGKGDPTLAVTK
jgi:hypothetical protein